MKNSIQIFHGLPIIGEQHRGASFVSSGAIRCAAMFSRFLQYSVFVLMFLFIAGCGEDSSTPKSTVKASDFNGSWRGTFSLSGAQTASDVSFSLTNITGKDETGLVVGSLYSTYVEGAFAGTLNQQGEVVGLVDNSIDGQYWTATVAKTDAGITVSFGNHASSASGSGVPGTPVGGGVDWKVTVTNKLSVPTTVFIYTAHLYAELEGTMEILPGETNTFHTGAWCPVEFTYGSQLHSYGCWAGKVDGLVFVPCCFNSTWEIQNSGMIKK